MMGRPRKPGRGGFLIFGVLCLVFTAGAFPRTPPKTERINKAAAEANETKAMAANADGKRHFAEARYDQALTSFGEAIRLRPTEAAFYMNRALVWLTKGDSRKAIEDCDKGIRLDPGAARWYVVRGNIFSSQEHW